MKMIIDIEQPFGIVFRNSSIGSDPEICIKDNEGRVLKGTFDTMKDAKDTAKRYNKMLSPEEKKHYGMWYTAVEMNAKNFIG